MQNKKRVKNIYVDNKYLYIDTLERELCELNVQYVAINYYAFYELHFLNYIYRIFDITKIKHNESFLLNNLDNNKDTIVTNLSFRKKENNSIKK